MLSLLFGSGAAAVLEALDRSQAIIEFKPDSTIVRVNANFLKVMGYTADEVVGQRHRLFVDSNAQGPNYNAFWDTSRQGKT
jgi:methyl-accepting chemotaxis protein